MCDQCDSAFCATQLTALIKPSWCVLLYCCACLRPNAILMEAGWTTVPCPATNSSILIYKSSARTKRDSCCSQNTSRNKTGNLYVWNVTSASTCWLYWFHTKLSHPLFTTKLRPCYRPLKPWASAGGKTGIWPTWKLGTRTKNLWKTWSQQLNSG